MTTTSVLKLLQDNPIEQTFTSVRGLADSLSSAYESPQELASAVLDKLGDDDLRGALAEILPQYVQVFVSRQRNSVINNRSAKADSIRDWFARFQSQLLLVEDGWKRLGDCSAADLTFAADSRRERAAAELARAEQWERLALAIEAAGVETLAELDEQTVRDALDGAS